MPQYVITRVMQALNDHHKPLKGSKVLVLGLAYKKYVDDLRASPAIALIEMLRDRGAKVDYNDPHIPRTHRQREHDLKMKSKPITAAALKKYDCVLVATDHSSYDYDFICQHAPLVVDTRNACANVNGRGKKVVKA